MSCSSHRCAPVGWASAKAHAFPTTTVTQCAWYGMELCAAEVQQSWREHSHIRGGLPRELLGSPLRPCGLGKR